MEKQETNLEIYFMTEAILRKKQKGELIRILKKLTFFKVEKQVVIRVFKQFGVAFLQNFQQRPAFMMARNRFFF